MKKGVSVVGHGDCLYMYIHTSPLLQDTPVSMRKDPTSDVVVVDTIGSCNIQKIIIIVCIS